MMVLLTMIIIDSESYLCFHINCSVCKVYEVGLPINFFFCIQENFLMKATCDIVLQTHSITVYIKKHAVPGEVRNKTKCAVLSKLKTRKDSFFCLQNLWHFHDKTTSAFSSYKWLNHLNVHWLISHWEVYCYHFIKNHRITEQVRLEGTTGGRLVQLPLSSRVILQHMAQDCVQRVLEYLQGGRLHCLSGQSVPVHGHLHSK